MSSVEASGPSGRGLLDIHCHGAMGEQFGDSVRGTRAAVAHHHARGVDGVVASLVSAPSDVLADQVRVLAPLVTEGVIDGIHIEGPFLSHDCRGAQDPEALRDPDPGLVDRLVGVAAEAGAPNALRHWTFAPELPGAEHLVRVLAQHAIRPAIGHTGAEASVVTRFLTLIADATRGAPLVTHLFNGMPPFHHRSGGPVSAAITAATRGEAYVELIADGVHVSPDVVRMVFETVGPDRIVLISDATAATGLGDGSYRLGALDVKVSDRVARLARDDGTPGPIAGSTSTLADAVEWAVGVAGISRADALRAATVTPRAALAR